MKKAVAFALFTLALANGFGLLCAQPSIVSAEGSEVVSVSSEQTSTETKDGETKIDLSQVSIDGKTLEEWKEALRNENTRFGAIITIVLAVGGGVLFILKWLNERGILKEGNALSQANHDNLQKQMDGFSKWYEEQEAKMKEREEQLKQWQESLVKREEELGKKAEQYHVELSNVHTVLDTIMQTDPTMVAAGVYSKAKQKLAEAPHEEAGE